MKSGITPFLIIVTAIAVAILFLSGCQTKQGFEIECDAATPDTKQTIKMGDQEVEVGAIRKIKYGNKEGANEWSDNKSFTFSMFNAGI